MELRICQEKELLYFLKLKMMWGKKEDIVDLKKSMNGMYPVEHIDDVNHFPDIQQTFGRKKRSTWNKTINLQTDLFVCFSRFSQML